MSYLSQEFNIDRVVLTKELHAVYYKQILDLIVSQYFEKDPSSIGVSYDEQLKYFEEEFLNLFTTDDSQIVTFLYFDGETKEFVGTFMMRDAYKFNLKHKEQLVGMDPEDKFRDYFERITGSCDSLFQKYNIKERECIYGTNLAIAPQYMKKIRSKGLKLIYSIFVDSFEWCYNNGIKYGIWTQFKPSLIVSTQALFKIEEAKDFDFIGGDKSVVKGKLFLVTLNDREALEKTKLKMNETSQRAKL